MAENPQANNSSISPSNMIDGSVLNRMMSVAISLKTYGDYFYRNRNHSPYYNKALDRSIYNTYEEMRDLVQELITLHSQIALQTMNTQISTEISKIKSYVPNGYIETGLGESLHVLIDMLRNFYSDESLIDFTNACDCLISEIQSIYLM